VEFVQRQAPQPGRLIMLTPAGRTLDQRLVESLACEPRLLLLCGRYEGFDERIRLGLAPLEISIGDYITNGGEVPAMVLIETLIRLVPGVLGDETSNRYESFAESGRLEYPQYTRPREYHGMSVPGVLLNGNHFEIARWREAASLERTRERRGGDSASPTAPRTLSGLVPPPPGGPSESGDGSRVANPG
jgi:tRNA (guanine37-N1)-methyltransferase